MNFKGKGEGEGRKMKTRRQEEGKETKGRQHARDL
jgi:hypothetical protein